MESGKSLGAPVQIDIVLVQTGGGCLSLAYTTIKPKYNGELWCSINVLATVLGLMSIPRVMVGPKYSSFS